MSYLNASYGLLDKKTAARCGPPHLNDLIPFLHLAIYESFHCRVGKPHIAPPIHNDDVITVLLDYTAEACPARPKLLNALPEILLDSPFLDRSINARGYQIDLPKRLHQ
ncbi:MAG: hypothetical protein O7G28_11440, partial [Deltaproteobacteria bacterium]|nr:hypothetical protein [Deltaproteobacteria bacterium]